jgi:hypothetical protein
VPLVTYTQKLHVYAAGAANSPFVRGTFGLCVGCFAVRYVYVGFGDVYVVEEVVVHVMVIALFVGFLDGVVFVKVESGYLRKIDKSGAVHTHKFGI